MSLQLIFGASGSGKTTWACDWICREAAMHREKTYIMLVPDQFTLETQKRLVAKNGGILNIDVLSFHRLAYRAFEEFPALKKTVLEDMGKIMILRSVFAEQKNNLKYFHKGLYNPGFLDECKSFLCEMMEYSIGEEELGIIAENVGEDSLTALKLHDIRLIYEAFCKKMGDTYMMAEELAVQLAGVAGQLQMLRDSVVVLDGFTGFTPVQYELVREFLLCCGKVLVTVATDRTGARGAVFSIGDKTARKLGELAEKSAVFIEEPVVCGEGEKKIPYRVKSRPELCFLEENLFSYQGRQWDKPVSDIELVVCRKESDEAEMVARRIFWLAEEEGYSYGSIAVVVCSMESCGLAVAAEMERLGIPYFLDYKKNIGANALAEYILSFMEMIRKGMDCESTFRFLRCGLSPLLAEETDVLENYVIATGRRGIRSYRQQWESGIDRCDLPKVNEYRKKFVESIDCAVRELAGGKKTVRGFTEIFYRLIVKNELFGRLAEKGEAFRASGQELLGREYQRIYAILMDLFDEMVELLGDEEVTFREYEELLSAGISEGLVGFIPPSAGQVVIGDMRRSRLTDIRALFFVGATDDRMPAGTGSPGILSDSERRKISGIGIQLAPSEKEEAFNEQYYLYLTLTKTSEKLFVSYSRMGEDGSSKRPAYLISQIKRIFPGLDVKDDEKDASGRKILGGDRGKRYLARHLADGSFRADLAWWEIAAWHERNTPGIIEKLDRVRNQNRADSKLSREAAGKLYGSGIYGSVTRLEQFASCPYAHFLVFGLGLRERQKFDVGAAEYGIIFHAAMEHFSQMLEDGNKSWAQLSGEEVFDFADACIEYAVEEYRGDLFCRSKRMECRKNHLKRILRISAWGMWRQMRAGSFTQGYTEQPFSGLDGLDSLKVPLDGGKVLVLGGKIDRADICEMDGQSFIKLIDYKSQNRKLDLCRVYHGLQLQLLTYMEALVELQKKADPSCVPVPAAVLYYPIDEPELEWKSGEPDAVREERLLAALRSGGYVNSDIGILKLLDKDFGDAKKRSSLYPAGLKKDGSFDSYSRVLDTEQFMELMKYTKKKAAEFGERIFGGEIAAAPCLYDGQSGCDYCEFFSVCGVEARERKNCSVELEKMGEEKIWEALRGENEVDGRTKTRNRNEK